MKTFFKNAIEWLSRPFSENIIFFVMMFLLGTFCIIMEPWNGSRFWSLPELFFDVYLLCAILTLLPRRIRGVVRWLLSVVLYTVAIVDTYCYSRLHSPITPTLYKVFLQSDSREANEVVEAYVDSSSVTTLVGGVLLIALIHIVASEFSKRIVSRPRNWLRQHAGRVGAVIGVVALLCGMTAFANKRYHYYRFFCQKSDLEIYTDHGDLGQKTKFYIPIYRLFNAMAENHRQRIAIRQLDKTWDKALVQGCAFKSPCIVLVIGESYNRSHSALYGYDKPTTPWQVAERDSSRLVAFSDVITSWNMTCEAWQNMFSTYSVGDDGYWYDNALFTQLYRRAGYKVKLMSNQFIVGVAHAFSDFNEDIFINDETLSRTQFDARNDSVHKYDEGLLDDFRHLDDGTRNLYIFHLMGMHSDYSERYPAEYARFAANDYKRSDLDEDDRAIIAAYDNAVLYNDYVLHRIIDEFKNRDAIIIHVPDHGEMVFDNGVNTFGRSMGSGSGETHSQYDIPFWIWCSDKYKKNHPDVWQSVMRAKDKPFMTDDLPHLMISLAGIKCQHYRPDHDLLSNEYSTTRKRIIAGEREYR